MAQTRDKRKAKGSPSKRITLGEAMRERGLDERKLAQTYEALLKDVYDPRSAIKPNDLGKASHAKTMLEALRDCCKMLGAYSTEDEPAEEESEFHLIHSVERPARIPATDGEDREE
jgi:hypothetical protein